MNYETIFTNAVVVLPDAVVRGTLVVRDGRIVDVQAGPSAARSACDMDGDYLIPGIVDTHTDNLERQVQPRALARWPSRSAMVAHDAQCAAAGVTTVFDALCLGDLGFDKERIRTFRDGVVDLDALNDADLLKAEHFLHLRCEVPAMDMLATVRYGSGPCTGSDGQPDGSQSRRWAVRRSGFLSRTAAARRAGR